MTEPSDAAQSPPPDRNDDPRLDRDDDPPQPMPRWIPALIGLLLVTFATLAVITGMRYRERPLGGAVKERRERTTAPAPPGEPGAGASLVLHGQEGDTTPAAGEPFPGESQTVITGGPGGVTATARTFARRGMVLNVLPEDAMVFVNGVPIGQVSQFNTMDEVYDFAQPGSYTVRIAAPNGIEATFLVIAAEDAKQEVARISARLER